jgi:hypothetical protein
MKQYAKGTNSVMDWIQYQGQIKHQNKENKVPLST